MFAEQKKVNRHARLYHTVEAVVVTEGTGTGPGAAAADAAHCAPRQVQRQQANSVVTTVGGRTSPEGALSLQCAAPGCLRAFQTPG